MSTLPPDRHARYSEVLKAAMSLFGGDLDATLQWMSRPVAAFGRKAPAAMVTTRQETDTVIDFIRRLEHGFVA
ncbi:antitoxin Xre/MbcA/ParS toxin-binding domain-containing protein [Pseudomonas sp. SC11]|uniref:antitoxin Xre/MbcA/ParS toxin-binding domain-containing protein n=1 Tax=Pseudomonas sp. SC11 TaxID=326927 RepID=UPI00399A0548